MRDFSFIEESFFKDSAHAVAGDKLFVLTHSRIQTHGYASAELSASHLLRELELEREVWTVSPPEVDPVEPSPEPSPWDPDGADPLLSSEELSSPIGCASAPHPAATRTKIEARREPIHPPEVTTSGKSRWGSSLR